MVKGILCITPMLPVAVCCVAQNGPYPHFEVVSIKSVSRDVRNGVFGGCLPW